MVCLALTPTNTRGSWYLPLAVGSLLAAPNMPDASRHMAQWKLLKKRNGKGLPDERMLVMFRGTLPAEPNRGIYDNKALETLAKIASVCAEEALQTQ